MPKLDSGGTAIATPHDVKAVLGEIDSAQLLAIISLHPTIANLEQASLWLEGDTDVFGPGKPIKGVASDVVTILTENEEEEPSRAS
jgi:hypothetical protein